MGTCISCLASHMEGSDIKSIKSSSDSDVDSFFTAMEEESDENISDDEVKSIELNEEVLTQLRSNDHKVTSLEVAFFGYDFYSDHFNADSIDWKKESKCIADNTHLKSLTVNCGLYVKRHNKEEVNNSRAFYKAISKNKSIRHLFLKGWWLYNNLEEILTILLPFFEQNGSKLKSFTFNILWDNSVGCDRIHIDKKITDRLITLLSKCTSLQRFGIQPPDYNFDTRIEYIDDESVFELLTELAKHQTLQNLTLTICNRYDRVDYKDLLLHLTKLEELNLYCGFDEEEAICLGGALEQSNIKVLRLEGNSDISLLGWRALGRYIGISSTLEKLNLSELIYIGDESMAFLGSGLANCTALRDLSIMSHDCTRVGWLRFFNQLIGSDLTLTNLDFYNNYSFDDDVMASMLTWLSDMPSLEALCMSLNQMLEGDEPDDTIVTSIGWSAMANLLQNTNSSLRSLDLTNNYEYNINDEVIISFASALVINNTLECLQVDFHEITTKGWAALVHVLCNKSSLESIYTSNHTLQVRIFSSLLGHPELDSLVQLNENEIKAEVARQKIIQYHFCNGSRNVEKFVEMELGELPQALAWAGRNDTGHSLFYQICQSMPSLFDIKSNAKASNRKILSA